MLKYQEREESFIHHTAIVDDKAVIGKNVKIGAYSIIGPDVVLHDNVTVQSHVVINGRTTIGTSTEIFSFASIGNRPQDLKYNNEPSELIIGSNNVIREYVTINPGTEHGGMKTIIGNNNLLMIGVHVAHDCIVGNNVIIANNVPLAGHVEVDDHVIIGGITGVHQFVKIGKHAMIGGYSGLRKDVPPFVSVSGNPGVIYGLNVVGLRRRGFTSSQVSDIKLAFNTLLIELEGKPFSERFEALPDELLEKDYIKEFTDFILNRSDRGICKTSQQNDD